MSIYEKVKNEAGQAPKNSDWYRDRIITELTSLKIKKPNGFSPGNLYLFAYNPKLKEEGHDRFPLVFVMEMRNNGFIGCNLHYISPDQRDEVAFDFINKTDQANFAVPPQTLRRYLFSGVQGIPYYIPESEWRGLVELPTEKFIDAKGNSVRSNRYYKGN